MVPMIRATPLKTALQEARAERLARLAAPYPKRPSIKLALDTLENSPPPQFEAEPGEALLLRGRVDTNEDEQTIRSLFEQIRLQIPVQSTKVTINRKEHFFSLFFAFRANVKDPIPRAQAILEGESKCTHSYLPGVILPRKVQRGKGNRLRSSATKVFGKVARPSFSNKVRSG